MLINIRKEYAKALKKDIDIRIGNDDPTITYQEYILYYILYANVSDCDRDIDPEEIYNNFPKDNWFDENWAKKKASKNSPKVFDKKWDEVF